MPPCQPPWWSSFLLGEWTKVWCPAMKKMKGNHLSCKGSLLWGGSHQKCLFPRHATQWPFFPKDVWNLFLKIVSHLTLCSSAVHVWFTFFPKASLGVPFFQRSLVGLPFFQRSLVGLPFFQRSLVEHCFPNFLYLQQPFFQRFTFWTWHWLPWKQCCQPCWPIASTLSLCPLPPWLCWQFLEA